VYIVENCKTFKMDGVFFFPFPPPHIPIKNKRTHAPKAKSFEAKQLLQIQI